METLSDELLARVLAFLQPGQLATSELCCRRWRQAGEDHGLWQGHAQAIEAELRAGGAPTPDLSGSGPSWKARFLELQFLRASSSNRNGYLTRAWVLTAHQAAVAACAVSGSLMATGGFDKVARVWDLAALQPFCTQPLHALPHPSPVIFVAFASPEALLTATPCCGYLWRGGRLVRRLGDASSTGAPRITCAVAWDMFLCTGMADGSLRVYDTYSGALQKLLRPHGHSVTALTHNSYQGWDLLLSAAEGENAVVFSDSESGLPLAEARLPGVGQSVTPGISSLALNPALGQLVAAVGGTLVSWDCGADLALLPTPYQRVEMDANRALRPGASKQLPAVGGGMCLALPAFGGTSCLLLASKIGTLNALSLRELQSNPLAGDGQAVGSTPQALSTRNPALLRRQTFPLVAGPERLFPQRELGVLGVVGWSRRLVLRPDLPGGESWYAVAVPGGAAAWPGLVGGSSPSAMAAPSKTAGTAAAASCMQAAEQCQSKGSSSAGAATGGAQQQQLGTSAIAGGGRARAGSSNSANAEERLGTLNLGARFSGPAVAPQAQGCSCICAERVPVVTGHMNGQVVLWDWVRAS